MDGLQPDALRAFIAFADTRNFTTAAQLLHISQPALHVKIQKLAHSLGEDLYERVGRDLILTPAGTALAAFARAQRLEAEDFLRELKGLGNRPLVLACGRGAFMNVIDRGISTALKQKMKLQFIIDNTPEMIDMVERGTADVAVGVFTSNTKHLSLTPLASFGQHVVVSKRHPWAQRKSLSVTHLRDESLAVAPLSWPQRQSFNRIMHERGIAWNVAVEAPGWELLVQLAALGVAPAIVNAFATIPSNLASVPLRELPAVEYSILTRREQRPGVVDLVNVLLSTSR